MSPISKKRRPGRHVTESRAARLYHLAVLLDDRPQTREEILQALKIKPRTFYRELEFLKRCGVKVRLEGGNYQLQSSLSTAEFCLPFPDPKLSFAEIAELSSGTGPAARRLAGLRNRIVRNGIEPLQKRAKPNQEAHSQETLEQPDSRIMQTTTTCCI